jgi:energy-converting hydrogenase Eha subunit A
MGAMRRIAAAAVALGLVATVLVLALARTAPVRGVEPRETLVVSTSFAPSVVQFGDRVVARVVVLADRQALDTSRLRVTQDIAPLSRLPGAHVTRTTRGRLFVATYEVPATCIVDACLAPSLRLPPARADAPQRDGGTAHAQAPWPVLAVGSRVTATDLKASRPHLRGDTSAPSISYRIDPATLSYLLDAAAVLLALTGVGLAAWQATALVRRRRRTDQRSEVAFALELVREAASRPPEDRRRAVGLLARVLRRNDDQLAATADNIAWSRPKPTPEGLAALADRVDGEGGGR